MSEHEDFEKIVAGEGIEEMISEKTPWDSFTTAWQDHAPGVLVKGMYIVEFVDEGGRALRYVTSPDMSQWDMLGFLNSVLTDVQSERMAMQLFAGSACDEDEEGD